MPVHCAPPYGSIQRVTHTHVKRQTYDGKARERLGAIGPALARAVLRVCRDFPQICGPSDLRSSDEPSVRIGL
eukprot:6227099-Prymnesium_polylepis.1